MNMKVERKNQFLINKVFSIPYIDKLIDTKNIPNSLCQCINCYVKGDDLTYFDVFTKESRKDPHFSHGDIRRFFVIIIFIFFCKA